MRRLLAIAVAVVGLAAWRGLLPASVWPFPAVAGLLLLLPLAAVLLASLRRTRERRLRRYGLGW